MICHRLMQGHAASMSIAECPPRECMPNILKGSLCIGSRCALWTLPYGGLKGGPGLCADGPGAIPWPDPNGTKETT